MGAHTGLRDTGNLVGLVYEGIEESTPWKSLMAELSEATESHDASLLIASAAIPGAYRLITDNDDPHLTGGQHLAGVMSVNVMMQMRQPKASTLDELMPHGEFLDTALYQRFLKPHNLRYLLGQDVLWDDVIRVKLSIERTGDQKPYGDREKALVEFLTPHLQRAIRLRERKQRADFMRILFEDAMEKLAIGCMMLDARGRVVSMNERAGELLGSSGMLSTRNGRLRARESADARRLEKLIDETLAARGAGAVCAGAGLRLESAPGVAGLDLVVKSIAADPLTDAAGEPAVVVYLNDSTRPGIALDPAVLGAMYGLTPSEARIGALLAKGTGLTEIGEQLGVSVNTVKTHLRGIYEKLDTGKQAQLVARLNHSSARLI